MGRNYLGTVHSSPIRAIATARRLGEEWIDRSEAGAGLLAYLLIEQTLMTICRCSTSSASDGRLEDSIFGNGAPRSLKNFHDQENCFTCGGRLTPGATFLIPCRREQPIFPAKRMLFSRTYLNHLIRVADNIDTLRDMLSSTMDAYLSVQEIG